MRSFPEARTALRGPFRHSRGVGVGFLEKETAWRGPFRPANVRLSTSTRYTPSSAGVAPEPAPLAPTAGSTIKSELLPISIVNIIPPLSQRPDGQMTILYVNGRAFSDVSGAFSVSGNAITWASTIWGVSPGNEVVACYTYEAAP